ncbi:zinc-finger domain-containing protein [Halovulum dunhuangense]|uniref:Zinc-finger domain-containing protein n=1 Tax=Halovulum dunhuangense TaxID=1505036 RepID=A0A849KRT0_9RHOB|nr:zinc-finger domain-containing protein [Halovulum dunhuangense]NNU79569.1 zinc-finger domain-containing protein [Halovulum dunhuangense]
MTPDAPEVEIVTKSTVACDGGTLGHPRVWLTVDPDKGYVECGYCDKRYVLKGGPADRS